MQPHPHRALVAALTRARVFPLRRYLPWRAPTQPDGIRLQYYRALRDEVVAPLRAEVAASLEPVLAYRGDDERFDAFFDRAKSALESLRARITAGARERAAQAANIVRRIFTRTSAKSEADTTKAEHRAGSPLTPPIPNLASVAEVFVTENVALITSIPERLLSDVEALMLRAASSGTARRDLVTELRRRYDISLNRAKLIARDQVGKLYGQLAKERQTALGIEKFIWRTQRDNRVRDAHAALEGTTWRWDAPPSIGIPGEPINCRCFGEPLI